MTATTTERAVVAGFDDPARGRARRMRQLIVEDFLGDRGELLPICRLLFADAHVGKSGLSSRFPRGTGCSVLICTSPAADRLFQILQQLAGAALSTELDLSYISR